MADENAQVEQPQAAEKTQAKKGGKKGGKEKAEVEAVRLGPANVDYSKDNVFGVAHIYASFNDTFVVRYQRFYWIITIIIDYYLLLVLKLLFYSTLPIFLVKKPLFVLLVS